MLSYMKSCCRLAQMFSLAALTLDIGVSAYTALPRWGQAAAIINDALFIQGGKTDQYNSYSYTEAPTNDDLLFLSLSSSFDPSSPPWQLISTSTNSSTPQGGPDVAWHTLSALNTSEMLAFGGKPGENSDTVLPGLADSAILLNVFDRLLPEWSVEATSWAGEPMRRMYHSATTTVNGLVLIIGGMKADGSNTAFSDHYIFDPNGPTFTSLSTSNAPPDIYGHASIILPNGLLLVFGGYCESQSTLLAFTEIWALNTTESTLTWNLLTVNTSSVPAPRRGFVAVLVEESKILIQGGCDAEMQNCYSDGWILDTSQNPLVWTEVDALSQLGVRRDHFAVAVGTEVIFGFGYGTSAPASADLQIYDISSGSFVSTFSPLPSSSTPPQTIPGPTQTSAVSGGITSLGTGTGTISSLHPTSTESSGSGKGSGSGTSTSNGNGTSSGSGNGDGNSSSSTAEDTSSDRSHTTAIAVGTAFGISGLLAVGCAAFVYYRRKERQRLGELRLFTPIAENDEGSPHIEGRIPVAGAFDDEKTPGWSTASKILTTLGLASATSTGPRNVRTLKERRDMLADEDTRDFGWDKYSGRGRDGSAGSNWSLISIITGRRGLRSREPSSSSAPAGLGGDPFSDGAALLRDEESGYFGAAALGAAGIGATRPRGKRQSSYDSSRTTTSYVDPFADPIQEEHRDELDSGDEHTDRSTLLNVHPSEYTHLNLPAIQTMYPLSVGVHTLSPLTEQTSRGSLSLSQPSSTPTTSSHDNPTSSFEGSNLTSGTHTSYDPSSPRPTSIVDNPNRPNPPLRRSDTWWARFSRTGFLDRRLSDSSKRNGMMDIRDPNPVPRLLAIEESQNSVSPEHDRDSPKSHASGKARGSSGSRVYGGHGRSMSSLKTARTADSEAIERMGAMDVAQRVVSDSRRTRNSTGSTSTNSSARLGREASDVSTEYGEDNRMRGANIDDGLFTSPAEMAQIESHPLKLSSPVPSNHISSFSPPRTPGVVSSFPFSSNSTEPTPTDAGVASRIKEFERRMSQGQEVLPPTNTKRREEIIGKKPHRPKINYGLVPRASLYVANPDHRVASSGDS